MITLFRLLHVGPCGALLVVLLAWGAGCGGETREEIKDETRVNEALPAGTAATVEQASKVYEVYQGILKPLDGPPTITLAKFEEVPRGVTYENAVSIIGAEADVITDDEVGPAANRRRVAQWFNGDGSSATFTFINVRLMNKVQSGLE